MKKGFFVIAALVLFLATLSCGKENGGIEDGASAQTDDPGEPLAPGAFRAVADPDPDAVPVDADFSEDDLVEESKAYPSWTDSKAQVFWKKGDLVRVYYDRSGSSGGVYKVVSGGGTPVATLDWQSGDKDSEAGTGSYFAAYPSSAVQDFSATTFTLTLPSVQRSTSSGMPGADQAAQLMLAKCGPERILNFKQVVSMLRFGFQTDFPDGFYCSSVKVTSATSNLAGNLSVSFTGSKPVCNGVVSGGSRSVTLNSAVTTLKKGAYAYAFVAPGTYEAGDLTFEFTITNGTVSYKMTKVSPEAVSFERGKYYQFRFALPAFTDLSETEKANCYVVDAPGYYCFDVSTRGNGVVTTGATAAGLTGTITGGASVSQYHSDGSPWLDTDFTGSGFFYAGGKVYFKTVDAPSAANSLLSLKDASGNTLWSWHLWYNDALADIAFISKYDSETYTFLNMNLGAHQQEFNSEGYNGYYYQWGRKDPFQQKYGDLSAPFVNSYTDVQGSLADAILHPETIYGLKSELEASGGTIYTDWWCAGLTTANVVPYGENNITAYSPAAFSKTMFDPCPPGYHVPTMAAAYSFRGNTFTSSDGVTKVTDASGAEVVFPLVNGRLPNINATYWGVNCYFWSCYPGGKNNEGTTPERSAPRFWMTTGGSGYNNAAVDRRCACIIRCQKN